MQQFMQFRIIFFEILDCVYPKKLLKKRVTVSQEQFTNVYSNTSLTHSMVMLYFLHLTLEYWILQGSVSNIHEN